MVNTPLSLKSRMLLLVIGTVAFLALSAGTTLWQMRANTARTYAFLEHDLSLERHLTRAYAQGLQAGQAIRSVLIDPKNTEFYDNYGEAVGAFQKHLDALATAEPDDPRFRSLIVLSENWRPFSQKVVDSVQAGNLSVARAALVYQETPAWQKIRGALLQARDEVADGAQRARADLDAGNQRAVTSTLLLALAAVCGCAITAIWVVRSVTREIGCEPSAASRLAQTIAKGDLASAPDNAKPGQDSLMAHMASMRIDLNAMIAEIRDSTSAVREAIDAVASNTAAVTQDTQAQSDAGVEVARSVDALTTNISRMAGHAERADALAGNAAELANDALNRIEHAVTTIRGISSGLEASGATMARLEASADGVSSVVSVIRGIADQTNMLALNAAVEAARAGEQGRGFAVVADEVRKLAERTAHSTEEIARMIGEVQDSAHEAIERMRRGQQMASEGVSEADHARDAMQALHTGSEATRDAVRSIATRVSAQRTASDDINKQIIIIGQMTERTHANAKDSFDQVERLSAIVDSLRVRVGHFRLG